MIPVQKLRELKLERPEGDERSSHISAASALLLVGSTLYVAADDERQLGIFEDEGRSPGRLMQILPGRAPSSGEGRKKRKPDVESLCLLPAHGPHARGGLLAMSSGSGPGRHLGAFVPLGADGLPSGHPRPIELGALFDQLREHIAGLNVEGAAVRGDTLHLMQRGNNGDGPNARVDLDLAGVMDAIVSGDPIPGDSVQEIHPYDLGQLAGVKLCFSDASPLPDRRLVFSCSAEDSEAGGDGLTVGSALGILSPSGEVDLLEPIDLDVKLEGMTALDEGERVRVLLVTDADDPSKPSPLLETYL